jgi:hypothetical protein
MSQLNKNRVPLEVISWSSKTTFITEEKKDLSKKIIPLEQILHSSSQWGAAGNKCSIKKKKAPIIELRGPTNNLYSIPFCFRDQADEVGTCSYIWKRNRIVCTHQPSIPGCNQTRSSNLAELSFSIFHLPHYVLVPF